MAAHRRRRQHFSKVVAENFTPALLVVAMLAVLAGAALPAMDREAEMEQARVQLVPLETRQLVTK
jgi:hypothetical protein